MRFPSVLLQQAVLSGSAAAIVSAAVLVARGKAELDAPAAPMNGPSQWVWGLHAPYRDSASWRHTAVGYVVHHIASIFWACFYEYALARRKASTPLAPLKIAGGTAAAAAFVDYCLTPERLTPGFQKRLSAPGMMMVYSGFAAGLAIATLLASTRKG